jgi:hypothetical protein
MHPVFNDSLLQKQFGLKGYIILPGILTMPDLEALMEVYAQFQTECTGPFHTSHFSTDITYKKQAHDSITSIVFPRVAALLNNFAPLFGNFMIKNPDPSFSLDLHADWTYVDEKEYGSVAVWIPMVDVDTQNGCLGVIEGSHRVTNSIRGPLIRQSSRDHEGKWEKRYGKMLPLKAGDAVIYNHALLHYSHANKTNKVRPALNLSLAPADVPWLHYCQPEGAMDIELYSVPGSDFYIHYDHFQRPQASTLIKKLPVSSVEYMKG